jgi:hypothetical protein
LRFIRAGSGRELGGFEIIFRVWWPSSVQPICTPMGTISGTNRRGAATTDKRQRQVTAANRRGTKINSSDPPLTTVFAGAYAAPPFLPKHLGQGASRDSPLAAVPGEDKQIARLQSVLRRYADMCRKRRRHGDDELGAVLHRSAEVRNCNDSYST